MDDTKNIRSYFELHLILWSIKLIVSVRHLHKQHWLWLGTGTVVGYSGKRGEPYYKCTVDGLGNVI